MRVFLKLSVILSLVALSLSCSEGLNTLFDLIVNDSLITNNQLEDDIDVTAMTKMGTYYYIAAGNIRYRDESGSAWSALALADGLHHAITVNGAGDALYAGVIFNNGTGGLYRYDGTLPAAPVSFTSLDYIAKVKRSNGTVYASIQKTVASVKTFSLCTVAGTTGTEIAWVDALDLTSPVSDFFDSGTYLYLVSGNKVYRSPGPGFDITPNAAYTYSSIFAYAGLIYVGTQQGMIYRSSDDVGSSWTAHGPYTYDRLGTKFNARFTEFIPVEDTGPTLLVMLVGTRGGGFYEIKLTPTFSIQPFSNSSINQLYYGAIESFYVETAASPRVFICTMGTGLWNNTYSAAGWGGTWTQE